MMKKNIVLNRILKSITLIAMLLSSIYSYSQTFSPPVEGSNSDGKYYELDIEGPSDVLKVTLSESYPIEFHNATTAKIQINPSGGWGPYIFLVYKNGTLINTYSNESGQKTLHDLSSGTYKVVVRDSKYERNSGRTCNEVSDTIVLSNPPILEVSTSSTLIKCNNGEATIKAIASGGVIPDSGKYEFELFKDGDSYQTLQSASEVVFRNLTGTSTYYVILHDKFDQEQSSNILIQNPSEIKLQASNISKTHVECKGESDGTITITPTGGRSPYKVYLNNNLIDNNVASSKTIKGLSKGSYNIRVTYGDGCESVSINEQINEPAKELVIKTVNKVSKTSSTNNDGWVELKVEGGTKGYTYTFKGGDNNLNISGSITNSGDLVKFENLHKGNYIFEVADLNKCKKNISIKIINPVPLSIDMSSTNVKCFGGNDGIVTANASGGFAQNYTYEWYKENASGAFVSFPTTPTSVSSINAGIGKYKVQVNVVYEGAVIETQDSEVITIQQPSAELQINEPVVVDVSCKGEGNGSITLNPSGGTPPYKYLWSNGETTKTIDSLPPGNYSVKVTDSENCFKETNVTIKEPTKSIKITIKEDDITNATVNGGRGKVKATVEGGTINNGGDYTYKWYKLPNITTPVFYTKNITPLAGIYQLVVIDSNGCEETSDEQIITEPQKLAVTIKVRTGGEITCSGNSDGVLVAEASGGLKGYTYQWYKEVNGIKTNIPGKTSSIIDRLSAGGYGVRVTDRDGLGITADVEKIFTLSSPELIDISVDDIVNVKCFNQKTGKIMITPSGGTLDVGGQYTFKWYLRGDPSKIMVSTKQNPDNLKAGFYIVEVTDNRNCKFILADEKAIKITQPTKFEFSDSPTSSDAKTNGVSNGSVTVKVQGGDTDYTYTLTKKSNGSQVYTTTTSNNELTLTNLSGSVSGIEYIMTISDTHKVCDLTHEFTIKEPEVLTVSLDESRPITCNNSDREGSTLNTGDIKATASGGFLLGGATYTYEWYSLKGGTATVLSGVSTQEITRTEGSYRVVVTDSNGNTASSDITISEPLPITIDYTKSDVLCFGQSTGSINLTVSGGSEGASYDYSWSHLGENVEDVNSLPAGDYTVIVNRGSCSQISQTITITQPTKFEFSEVPMTSNASTNGVSNGSITVKIQGGETDYTYTLTRKSDGSKVYSTTTSSTELSLTNLLGSVTGIEYIITVSDLHKVCDLTYEFTIKEPEVLTVSLDESRPITCNSSDREGSTLNTGDIKATASGGFLSAGATYTYEWYSLKGGTATVLSGLYTQEITRTEGSYRVIVTDSNGNTASSDITISEPLPITISYTKSDVLCFGESTGSIDLTVSGGREGASYDYSWSHTGDNSKDVSGLPAGEYTVIINRGSCSQKSATIIINQPEEYKINVTTFQLPTGAGITDGKIEVEILGGTLSSGEDYNIEWSNIEGEIIGNNTVLENLGTGDYFIKVTDSNNCVLKDQLFMGEPEPLTVSISQVSTIDCYDDSSAELTVNTKGGVGGNTFTWYNNTDNSVIGTSATIYNLSVGEYYLEVTDANNITAMSSVYQVTQPEEIKVTSSFESLSCYQSNDGEINFSVTGGTGTYEYQLKKDNGSYADWQSFTDTVNLSNLSIGIYSVQIRDANNCYLEQSGGGIRTLEFNIEQPVVLGLTSTLEEVSGFGLSNGSITTTISGGTEPYTYQWTNSAGENVGATSSLSNIGADIYTLIVIDAQNCELSQEFIMPQPELLTVTVLQKNIVLCNEDTTASLHTHVEGGIPSYSYQWYEEGDTTIISSTSQLNSIGAGNYYVVVSDANDNKVKSQIYTVTQPDTLSVVLNTESKECGTDGDWSITANVLGGTAPYTYVWSSGQTTQTIENVSNGSYFVVVRDANGCQISQNVSIQPTNPLIITETVTHVTCYNNCEGEISLSLEGGQAPYTFEWSSGQTTQSIKNVCAGEYSVMVSDALGCVIEKAITINNAEEFIFQIIPNEVTLCEGETIEYDVTLPGVVTYEWTSTNGFTSNESIVTLSDAGSYTLTVTTNDGCKVSKDVVINKSEEIIDAQFILASQAFVGEDIIFINVSNPISSDVEWVIPSSVKIVQETAEGVVVRFEYPGNYDIQLIAREGSCIKELTKTINVQKARIIPDAGDSPASFISEFKVFSNPNNGQFKAMVKLVKEAEISLRLFDLKANKVIIDKEIRGDKDYEVDYDINVSSGVYLLLLETSKGSRIQKVVVN